MTVQSRLTKSGVEQLLDRFKITVNFWLGDGVLDCEITVQDTIVLCDSCQVIVSSDLGRAKQRLLARTLFKLTEPEQIQTILDEAK